VAEVALARLAGPGGRCRPRRCRRFGGLGSAYRAGGLKDPRIIARRGGGSTPGGHRRGISVGLPTPRNGVGHGFRLQRGDSSPHATCKGGLIGRHRAAASTRPPRISTHTAPRLHRATARLHAAGLGDSFVGHRIRRSLCAVVRVIRPNLTSRRSSPRSANRSEASVRPGLPNPPTGGLLDQYAYTSRPGKCRRTAVTSRSSRSGRRGPRQKPLSFRRSRYVRFA